MKRKYFKIGIIVIILTCALFFQNAETASAENPDFKVIIGEWVRPDGGCIVRVRDVNPDGSVDVGYYNPQPINVSRAEAILADAGIKLLIELRDVGYPGSTYTLIYNPQKDMMFGLYYQAAMGQHFDVVFVRTK
jgi:hypothetical protein